MQVNHLEYHVMIPMQVMTHFENPYALIFESRRKVASLTLSIKLHMIWIAIEIHHRLFLIACTVWLTPTTCPGCAQPSTHHTAITDLFTCCTILGWTAFSVNGGSSVVVQQPNTGGGHVILSVPVKLQLNSGNNAITFSAGQSSKCCPVSQYQEIMLTNPMTKATPLTLTRSLCIPPSRRRAAQGQVTLIHDWGWYEWHIIEEKPKGSRCPSILSTVWAIRVERLWDMHSSWLRRYLCAIVIVKRKFRRAVPIKNKKP